MHIVTYSSLFLNLPEAVSNTRALAVVGVFFEVRLKYCSVFFVLQKILFS